MAVWYLGVAHQLKISFIMLRFAFRAEGAEARGIAAEPPAKVRSTKAGDGADSPTRATKKASAAPSVRSGGFFWRRSGSPKLS